MKAENKKTAGCMNEISSGQTWDDMYLSLCSKHSAMKYKKMRRPKVKEYAIKRESKRDKVTGFLNS